VVFFNNYLKSGKKSKERFKPNLPNKEYIEQITDDNSMTAQLGNIVLKDSIEKALSFLNNNQKIFTNKENEINILSRLIRDSDADAAINILLWNVQYHPNSWQTLFELAKSYQVNEEFSMAKKTLLRAKEIDPENKEIISFQEEIYKSEK
jgi:tetratricopeptide (TPR) repeat protein